MENDPDDFESHYNLCIAFIQAKDKGQAEKLLQTMERMRPGFEDPQGLRTKIRNM